VQVFSLISSHQPSLCTVRTLNLVIHAICERKFVDVAKSVSFKVRRQLGIELNEETYRFLILGFCHTGEVVVATKLWNKMVAEGLEPDVDSYLEVVNTFFKYNRFEDAMLMFKSMRERRFTNLGVDSYHVVITWLCKEGRMLYVYMLFGEMLKRGVQFDCDTLGELIYGLLVRRRTREAYKVFHMVRKPSISLYHGLMKGLLRIKRAGEATEVLKEMLRRGCEPNMHTYIMLLQGHLGKRGRKGRDPIVNFESIFVGGLIKSGKTLETTKFVERTMRGAIEVPRFDYNKFLHCFSNEDGVVMFEEVGRRLKEAGMEDLGDIFFIYGERMATRDRRRKAMRGLL
jgi:pentatricopeptide repeat protein